MECQQEIRICAPLRLSRLPVGSSARIRDGSLTSARATATRCFGSRQLGRPMSRDP